MSLERNKQSGFTIIEVVLVLAIAGLIFLIVFLALPQLQRSRRDTQRRNDVGRVLASMEQFAANNSGQYPDVSAGGPVGTTFPEFLDDFFGVRVDGSALGTASGEWAELSDPSVGTITTQSFTGGVNGGSASEPTDIGQLYYYKGAFCNGQVIEDSAASTRQVAVATFLEQGGVYCGDNGGS